MPDIAASGTYDKDDAGFGWLKASPNTRVLLFDGSSVGTSVDIKYLDSEGVSRSIANGGVTALPADKTINLNRDLQIVVVGSPSFNVVKV